MNNNTETISRQTTITVSPGRERIIHIDVAKAFGMMLIVSSHIWISPSLSKSACYNLWDSVLNSFYVPLFFILSGVFESQAFDWKKYGYRLVKLLKYIGVFLLFGFITAGLIKHDWNPLHFSQQTTIWFLLTLFWISIIFGVIKHIKHNWCVVCALAIGGVYLSYENRSMFYVGQAMLCVPFYAIGYYLKDLIRRSEFSWCKCLLYALIWAITFSLFYSPQNLSLNYVSQNYVAFYVEAIAGSLFVIEISKLINWSWLVYYGKNSIVPMLDQMALIWLSSMVVLPETMVAYCITAVLLCLMSGVLIPVFRNHKYDIFK